MTRVGAAALSGKNPILAAILSSLIVGMGQFYNGDWKKGIAMFAICVVAAPLTGGIAWLPVAIWSTIDAYQVAKGKMKPW